MNNKIRFFCEYYLESNEALGLWADFINRRIYLDPPSIISIFLLIRLRYLNTLCIANKF